MSPQEIQENQKIINNYRHFLDNMSYSETDFKINKEIFKMNENDLNGLDEKEKNEKMKIIKK